MTFYGINTFGTLDDSAMLPQGPYFMSASTGDIYMAYRLYSDFGGSFTESLFATPTGNFTTLSAAIEGTASLTIGVPSRLYYVPSANMPLAGVRIGIKDIYDIAGVRTGNGNRAFYNLYPPATVNSVVVQKLVDAGAVIVGKQKTSQFANGQMATADWVDYHSPFNGRGDGYQDPSSSSAGAGASMGSYPWLDIALGSDTGGSIRGPSQTNGLFGNRPSHGAVELTGVMPLSPDLDTAGFLTRDSDLWAIAQEVLYGPLPTYGSYPSRILTVNFPTNASSSTANGLALGFLAKLQSFLSANVSAVNLTSQWAASAPSNSTLSLAILLNLTYPVMVSKQQTKLVRDPFYADYAAVHDGRRPFVDPAPLVRWAYADGLPDSLLDEALFNKTVFLDWFQSNILTADPVTCSNAFMIYLGGTGMSNARNQYLRYVRSSTYSGPLAY
jgi:Amidase